MDEINNDKDIIDPMEEDDEDDEEEPDEEEGGVYNNGPVDDVIVEDDIVVGDSSSSPVVEEVGDNGGEEEVQEADVVDVETAANPAEEEEEEVEGDLDGDDAVVFQEEIIDVMEHNNISDENDIRFMATTTDGELADDEGMDFISTPEDAVDLVGVTAGGAVVEVEEDDVDEEDAAGEEEATLEQAVDVVEIVQISDEMKDVLRNELHYTARDVQLMRPDIASMVVYNRLFRPIEGMPLNWYIEGAGPPSSALRGNAIKIALTAAIVGAVALVSLKGGETLGNGMSGMVESLKKIPAALVAIPKRVLSAAKSIKGKAFKALPAASSATVTATEPPPTVTEEAAEEKVDEVVHSIKPGSKTGPNLDEDKTLLDKFLTAIEKAVKGFFRIKI